MGDVVNLPNNAVLKLKARLTTIQDKVREHEDVVIKLRREYRNIIGSESKYIVYDRQVRGVPFKVFDVAEGVKRIEKPYEGGVLIQFQLEGDFNLYNGSVFPEYLTGGTLNKWSPSGRTLAGNIKAYDFDAPMWHPCTGEYVSSPTKFREITKAHGCEEVGNEWNDPAKQKAKPEKNWVQEKRESEELKQDIARAYDEVAR